MLFFENFRKYLVYHFGADIYRSIDVYCYFTVNKRRNAKENYININEKRKQNMNKSVIKVTIIGDSISQGLGKKKINYCESLKNKIENFQYR